MTRTSSNDTPELSVVIVSYHCRDLLLDCLESLAVQRAEVDLEILVVDNASPDDTAAAALSAYPWIDLEALDQNLGFARANNRAIARARGSAVLILNPDTVLPPGSLRACLDQLRSSPDVGVLSPRLVDRAGNLDRRCKRGFPTPWSSFCYFTGLDRSFRGPRSTRYTMGTLPENQTGDVESVSGAFMLMPKPVLDEVGGFDEQFFMYAEDIDLCLRAIAHGYRVRYWPSVEVIHVGAGSNVGGRRPAAANAAFFRTMAPFIRKHRPGVRGRITAGLVAAAAEAMYLASRLGVHRPASPTAEQVGETPEQRVATPLSDQLVNADPEDAHGEVNQENGRHGPAGHGERQDREQGDAAERPREGIAGARHLVVDEGEHHGKWDQNGDEWSQHPAAGREVGPEDAQDRL
jgi:N-acetylglucosaminyl-diphospho-decaprenol L-rhamnosyltransferase